MLEFNFQPKTDSKRAWPAVIVIGGLSGVLTVLSANAPRFRGVISLVAMIGFCISIYLLMRYVMNDYIYSVMLDGEDNPYFLVYRRLGRRESLMCRISVADIREIVLIEKSSGVKHVPDAKAQKYNFCPNLSPERYYVIKAKGIETNAEISVECTPEVRERLLEYAAQARAKLSADEE